MTTRLRQALDAAKAQRDHFQRVVNSEKEKLLKAEEYVAAILTSQKHVQEIAEGVQQDSHRQIAKVVSRCLSAVFKEPYELKIELERRRGRTEVEFTYLRNGYKVRPKLTSGGVLHVAALALRLSSLVLTQPPLRRVLFLDEPFQGLSATNLPKMAVLIETLCEELGVQLIICTHDPELEVGKVIRL